MRMTFLKMNNKEQCAYVDGAWDALNKVLNYINTLDEQLINKKHLYHTVFDIRPIQLLNKRLGKKDQE